MFFFFFSFFLLGAEFFSFGEWYIESCLPPSILLLRKGKYNQDTRKENHYGVILPKTEAVLGVEVQWESDGRRKKAKM